MNGVGFLVQRLLSDEVLKSLVGTRVWPLQLPDSVDQNVASNCPFIIYQVSSEPVNTMRFPYVQLRISSLDYSTNHRIYERLLEMFPAGYKYSDSSISVESVVVIPSTETTDDSTGVRLMVKLVEVRLAVR